MGVFNRAIPTIQADNKNQLQVIPQQNPYIDDIFDPILNAEVRKYLLNKYGNPITATLGGYAEGIDNALFGQADQWGILGSGMGILSGFGRSMDKAGDFIIGGLTEGVKGVTGQGMESPFYNIFVEDEDYSGGRLLAAMGNSMSKLAGAPKLTEQDFTGLWNIPSMGLELMTDPGILGGAVSKGATAIDLAEQLAGQKANPAMADIGQLLQDYDDFMAKASIDLTVPGLRQGGKALLQKIFGKLGNSSNMQYAEHVFNRKMSPEQRKASQQSLRDNAENMQYKDMYNEVTSKLSAIPEESPVSPPAADLNTAQAAVAVATTVPNTVREQISARAKAFTEANPDLNPYDANAVQWVVSNSDLTEAEALYVMRAIDTDLDTLFAQEQSEALANADLERLIHESAVRDAEITSSKHQAFFDDPEVKANLKITNPDLYANLPDTYTLDDIDAVDDDAVLESVYLNFLKTQNVDFLTEDLSRYGFLRPLIRDDVTELRNDIFNKIHEFAKRQYDYYTPGTVEDARVTLNGIRKIYDEGKLPQHLRTLLEESILKRHPRSVDVLKQGTPGKRLLDILANNLEGYGIATLTPSQQAFLSNYFNNLKDPNSWDSLTDTYYKNAIKNDNLFSTETPEFDYVAPSLMHIPQTSSGLSYAEEQDMWNSIFEALDIRPSLNMGYAKRSIDGDKIYHIDERELENVLPRILAEKTPEEAPELYAEYVHRLNRAYDIDNESARNSVLRGIGIDPKTRTVRNIQKTPVTLSPSEFTGRSDASRKLQIQYAHKRITDFVNKYPIKDMVKDPNFIRMFPNPKVRFRIQELFKEIMDIKSFTEVSKRSKNINFKTTDYFNKVKELSDYIVDHFTPVEKINPSLSLAFLEGFDSDTLNEFINSDNFFYTVATKVLSGHGIKELKGTHGTLHDDAVQDLIDKMNTLSKQGFDYEAVKDMVKAKDTLSYSQLQKTRDLRLLTPIRELNLTVKDFEDYDRVLEAVEDAKTIASSTAFGTHLPTSNVAADISELADSLQAHVVQPHEFRGGAVREHAPLPGKFWEAQDSHSDEMEELWKENEVTAGAKSTQSKRDRSSGAYRPDKYLSTSSNTTDTINIHSTVNNLIRLNPEFFATERGRKLLQKYFGESYQVKVHGDYGIFDGISKDAMEAYKNEVLPLVENIIERGFSPYVELTKNVSDELLKNPKYLSSDGYKLRALMGDIPGVKASPYAKAFKQIMDETVMHADDLPYKLANDANYIPPLDFLNYTSKSLDAKSPKVLLEGANPEPVLSDYAASELRKELQRMGVKSSHRDLVTAFLNKERLSPKEWRVLNTAFQNLNLSGVFKDIVSPMYYPFETIQKEADKFVQEFKDTISINTQILSRTYATKSDFNARLLAKMKHSGFFPKELTLPYYEHLRYSIPYFKNIEYDKLDMDTVVSYFIEHPDDISTYYTQSVASIPLANYTPGYLQYVNRFLYNNTASNKQIGWIDYSKLYGKGEADLWANLVNTIEVQSPWKDPITYELADRPRTAVENAIVSLPATTKVTSENATQIEERVLANITEASVEDAADIIADMPTPTEAIGQKVLNDLIPENQDMLKLSEPQRIGKENAPLADPAEVVYPEETTLFKIISDSMDAAVLSKTKDKATLRTDFVLDILRRAENASKKVTEQDVFDYMEMQTYLSGAKVAKEDFLNTLASSGFFEMAFKRSDSYSKVYDDMLHNVSLVNAAAGKPILKVFKHNLPEGKVAIGVAFDTSNKSVVRDLGKALKKLNTDDFVDIVRLAPGEVTESVSKYLSSDTYRNIDALFTDIRLAEEEFATVLGFKYDDMRHVKHVRNIDPEVAHYLTNTVYYGLDVKALDDISDQMIAIPEFKSLRGSWGSRRFDRRLIGYESDFNNSHLKKTIFSHNMLNIVKNSLGEGSFNNSKFQLYIDLFESDNFKIKNFVDGVEELEEVFNLRLPNGKLSGNMQNLALVAPRKDATGRVVGFTQFDKTTRVGLEQALKNPNTILIPTHILAPLDKALRKDAAMSNKVYAFISKHLTTPFKFGVLMNPGFLIGNANDAYLKQATTMAYKYGTSVPEELANVAASIRDVMVLNNRFDEAYHKVLTHIAAEGFAIAPTHKISELAASDPRIRQILKDYITGNLQKSKASPKIICKLSNEEVLTIRTWLALNSSTTIAAFSKGLQDMDVIAEAKNSSEYAPKANIFDRVLMGNGEYVSKDPSTWGLIVNNPLARAFMNASESTENIFRAASILNDFRHKGLGVEYFKEYFDNLEDLKYAADLHLDPETIAFKEQLKRDFNVHLSEGVNTMHHANFDYERMTNFTDTVGKFVPFPTFFLRNLGYWLEVFIEHPQYIDHAISIQQGLWNGKDTENDKFAAEAKGRGAIPLTADGQNMSTFFKGIYKPTPLQSMFGAFNLINNPVDDMYYRLHPLLSGSIAAASQLPPVKSIAADVLPQESIKYRPYSTDMYERNVSLEDENFNPLEYTVHRLNPMERATQNLMRLPDKLKQDKAQLSDFLPSIFQPDF